jgi:carboxypeptidase C (cathepsin A)
MLFCRIATVAVVALSFVTASTTRSWAQGAAASSAAGPGKAFVTKHAGTFSGEKVDYVATVAPTVLTDEKGQPSAVFYSIAYTRAGVADVSKRPILFLFNGGPGSASVFLHMGAFGPKRVVLPADITVDLEPPYRMIDNTYTILDVADLVFIDPAGTGYSRILPNADPKPFYTAVGDAKSVAQFILAWCKANGREASPRFTMGESYGTIRAVLVADELAKVAPLDGVVLFGQAVNMIETCQRAGNIVGYAVNMPALTAIAWYHNRIPHDGKSLSALLDESYEFATGEYLSALVKGRDLASVERQRMATRLAGLTGIGADYFLANNLVISKERFRRELLKGTGLIVGMYDGRYTGSNAPPPEPPVAAAASGKPLPGARPRGPQGSPDPSSKYNPAFEALVVEHLTTNLGVTLPDEYRKMDTVMRPWDYGNGGPASPFTDFDFPSAITRAMAAKPTFRLMVGTGIYDTSTTTGVARYLVARGTFPVDGVSLRTYDGGHMAYTNEAALKALTDDLRAFVTGQPLN